VTHEANNTGFESVSGAGDPGAAPTPAGDISKSKAASRGGGESPATRRRLAAGRPKSRATSRGSEEAQPEATKKFVAPHRMEKETFGAHLGGLIAVSLWRTSSWIVGHLPAGPTYRVGGWASVIGYYAASRQRRRWLRANFGHVLGVPPGDKAAGRLARAAYRNYSRYILELMRLPWMKKEKVEELLEVHSLDRFLEIYKESKGLVLVAAHLGNNEAAAAGFAKHGLEINVVGDDSSYRQLYELFSRQRESWGVKMIAWRNLRGVFGALRRHEGLVLLVDWGYREDGIPVKMFGSWTTLPAGPALLACKHGSAIVPFSINRQPDGTFRAAADDPILVASDSPADIAMATQKIADALEGHIAPAPAQWYNFKPIWPATAEEAARLEARHTAAMANDAKGAAPNGHNGGNGANGGMAAGRSAAPDEAAPDQPSVK
jgi:lauroyl/myristoyl acyltransferase